MASTPPGLEHLTVPLNLIPRFHKKNNAAKVETERETWMRMIWHAMCSEKNEPIADNYFHNPLLNKVQPNEDDFKRFLSDLEGFKANVKACVHDECTKATIKAASERDITTYDNDGVKMAIGNNLNSLSLALSQRLTKAVDKADLPALKSVLQDVYAIQYGDHMYSDIGDAWKSRALFVELQEKMRGKLIEFGGKGVQVSNPFSELFTKVYNTIRGKVSKHFPGLDVLKQSSQPRSQAGGEISLSSSIVIEKLHGFYIKFDFGDKEERGEKAWRLFQSGETGDLSKAKALMIQAHTLLRGIDPMAAYSLKVILSNLDNPSGG